MLFTSLSTVLLFTTLAHGRLGQIPVVDGVIGGVPTKISEVATEAPSKIVDAPLVSGSPVPGKLRYVENSGVCETTPGVFQASGYADLTATDSMWFWFFAARNNNSNAPLAIWLNGGPGSSSMIGLLQELGPCRINTDQRTVSLNPFSWSNTANMLFIDQPIGVGFSHGNASVGTTAQAAAAVWKMLQIFFNDPKFSIYQSRDFAIWTESYGGHYGPDFAAFFLSQNAAINAGTITGKIINLKVLGVGDGLTDPLNQYPGYISYAASNPYHPLVSAKTISAANSSFFKSGGCQSQIQACYASNGTNTRSCSGAQSFCNNNILSPLAGKFDVYDVRAPSDDPYPPDITTYLRLSSVTSKIGAEQTWTQSNDQIYSNFASTGDWMHNSAPKLETVINAGVRTIVYDGDADYILNFNGVEAYVNKLQTQFSSIFNAAPFQNYTVAGHQAGIFKNAGTFSYVRIFGAGHEVPAYNFTGLATGQAASQMFEQVMSGGPLKST